MRVAAFRAYARRAMDGAFASGRRLARAVGARAKDLGLSIGRGVGVGGDESRFGGERGRAWWLEEGGLDRWVATTRERILAWLERSRFERFPRFERLIRRLLGTGRPTPPPVAPELPRPRGPAGPLGARPLSGPHPEDAAAVRARLFEAHTRERAGLRDRVESHKRKS